MRPRSLSFALLLVISLVACCCCGFAPAVATASSDAGGVLNKAPTGNIAVELKARWQHTSLASEASEFFAKMGNQNFWQFVDQYAALPQSPTTPKQQFDASISIAEGMIGGKADAAVQLKLLRYGLAVRHFSPAIEAHQQLARQRFAEQPSQLDSSFIAVVQLASGDEIVVDSAAHLSQALAGQHAAAAPPQAPSVPLAERTFDFDHVYPCVGISRSSEHAVVGGTAAVKRVVLYADIQSSAFREAHKQLSESACSHGFEYVLRHFDASSFKIDRQDGSSNEDSGRLLSLQGYGVELIGKNLEYKQMDENILKYKKEHGEDGKSATDTPSPGADQQRSQAAAAPADQPPADPKQLGVQATQYMLQQIANNATAIQALEKVLHSFPSLFGEVSSLPVDETVRAEMEKRQMFVWGIQNALLLNGVDVDLEKVSIFGLFDIVQSELHWQDVLQSKLRLPASFAAETLRSLQSSSRRLQNVRLNLFRDGHERSESVMFINDIEKDADYSNFPASVTQLLEPAFYGQLRFARRNTFQAILVVDPTNRDSLEMMTSTLNMFARGYPVQIGFLFYDAEALGKHVASQADAPTRSVSISVQAGETTSDATIPVETFQCDKSSAVAKFVAVFEHFRKGANKKQLLHLVHQVMQSTPAGQPVSADTVSRVFNQFTRANIDDVMQQDVVDQCSRSAGFALKSGFRSAPPSMLFNGRLISSNDVPPHAMLSNGLNNDYHFIADMVRREVLTDSTEDLQSAIAKATGGMRKFNARVFETTQTYAAITDMPALEKIPFLGDSKSDSVDKHYTYVLYADLASTKALGLLRRLARHAAADPRRRMTAVHTGKNNAFAQAVIDAISASDAARLVSLIEMAQLSASVETLTAQELGTSSPASGSTRTITLDEILSIVQRQLLGKLRIEGNSGLVFNGRAFELSDAELAEWDHADFDLLEGIEAKRLESTLKLFDGVSEFSGVEAEAVTARFRSDALLGLASVLGVVENGVTGDRVNSAVRHMPPSSLKVSLNQERATLPQVVAVVNPFDEKAQKLVAMLKVLAEHFQLPTDILLNLPLQVENEPRLKKQWYQFVLDAELRFDEKDGSVVAPKARFEGLPATGSILTMNLHVPETWLIESTMADEDLDNINLASMLERGGSDTLSARYQLENIIVVGNCHDASKHGSTRGLQLYMGDRANLHTQDTLVMANYGYFQLKGNPNVWAMQLAPGRHSAVYGISETALSPASFDQKIVGAFVPPANGTFVTIPITSFDGPFVHLRVHRRAGMESADLFAPGDEQQSAGLLSKLGSMFGGGDTAKQQQGAGEHDKEQDYLNVFSLASGHMYERLLKIMILSVVKNTKTKPVKFYLVKNFFSPRFKEALPKLAAKYGFKYELVTYKWPTWLNKQTEKQRLIWAYKVLFLDVLFPLNVKKIIYVDADQVTRADMTELWDMDMGGAPLGFAPFCSDKSEMDGYKFWISGYWQQHLQGKPYHISALYRVDVDKLRSMYGGDQIRYYYDNLSKDPNSLSNLDQDLLNYSQHWVPIYTLPQEWLWCESWCSDKSKPAAKTIDLCNNPMTKEHKIESARRIIPEWTSLDTEASQVA